MFRRLQTYKILLGLRAGRLIEWWRVVRDAERRPSLRQWLEMVSLIAGVDFRAPVRDVVANYRKCVRCPFHDPTAHACALCGCHMPLKLAAGGGCAAKEIDPNSTVGF